MRKGGAAVTCAFIRLEDDQLERLADLVAERLERTASAPDGVILIPIELMPKTRNWETAWPDDDRQSERRGRQEMPLAPLGTPGPARRTNARARRH